MGRGLFLRNLLEFVALFATWAAEYWLIGRQLIPPLGLTCVVVVVALAKSAFFGIENLKQLWDATRENTAYHHFMMVMLVNMLQIIISFALDYHCLFCLNPSAFGNIRPDLSQPELVFEFIYYSVLNFTFFGYGDVTPQSIPAKLVTMTEVMFAFATVIFLLSDFISLKESLRAKGDPGP